MKILDPAVEKFLPVAAGKGLGGFVGVETETVGCVEQKGSDGRPLERGTVLPFRGLVPVTPKGLKNRVCHPTCSRETIGGEVAS